MTCHDARELFSARFDDALTGEERAGLEAHLAGCAECRRELARFEGTVGLLRAATPVRAPAGFVDRVLAAVRPLPWYRRLGRRLFWPLEVKLPLEAAALVLVAVGAVYLYERSPEMGRLTRHEPADTRATEQFQEEGTSSAPTRGLAKRAPGERPSSSVDAPAKDAPSTPAARSFEQPAQPTAPASPPVAPGRKEQAPAPPGAAAPSAAPPERAAETSEYAREGQRRDAAEEKSVTGALQDRRRLASKAAALTERSGRLAVGDREAAGRALAGLLARVGATEVARRAEGRDVVVEVLVPSAAYHELTEGLADLGRWQPDHPSPEPADATVRLTLRLSD